EDARVEEDLARVSVARGVQDREAEEALPLSGARELARRRLARRGAIGVRRRQRVEEVATEAQGERRPARAHERLGARRGRAFVEQATARAVAEARAARAVARRGGHGAVYTAVLTGMSEHRARRN